MNGHGAEFNIYLTLPTLTHLNTPTLPCHSPLWSRYTVGDARLLRKSHSMRSRIAIKSETTTAMPAARTETTSVHPSTTSLEMVANRYHIRF